MKIDVQDLGVMVGEALVGKVNDLEASKYNFKTTRK